MQLSSRCSFSARELRSTLPDPTTFVTCSSAAGSAESPAGRALEPSHWRRDLAAAGAVVMLNRGRRLLTLGLPDSWLKVTANWWGLPVVARAVVVDPVLALSRALARGDDVVIDAGVRAAA